MLHGRELPALEKKKKAAAGAGFQLAATSLHPGIPRDAERELYLEIAKLMGDHADKLNERGRSDANPAIPAGYTYLGQLIAHDLVDVAPSLTTAAVRDVGARALRRLPLFLETIYGGGPGVSPQLYEPTAGSDEPRTRFRFNRVRSDATRDAHNGDFQDIPRLSCPFHSGDHKAGYPDVLLADARNDDHVILSQLIVLFQAFHNVVHDAICRTGYASARSGREAAWARYEQARSLTVETYQAIVVQDYLRRVLDEDVYGAFGEAFGKGGVARIVPERVTWHLDRMLLAPEFSHAAFRFGHAMVNAVYDFGGSHKDLSVVLGINSATRPDQMPLDRSWVVDWAKFFTCDTSNPPNPSRLITPSMVYFLLAGEQFQTRPDETYAGLAFRDLYRAKLDDVMSVGQAVGYYGGSRPWPEGCVGPSDVIRRWFQDVGLSDPTGPVFGSLLEEPPLLYYLLAEAWCAHQGERLGPLGSRIVAATVFSILERTRSQIAAPHEGLKSRVFGETAPTTMPQLIAFVATNDPERRAWTSASACQCPFHQQRRI